MLSLHERDGASYVMGPSGAVGASSAIGQVKCCERTCLRYRNKEKERRKKIFDAQDDIWAHDDKLVS